MFLTEEENRRLDEEKDKLLCQALKYAAELGVDYSRRISESHMLLRRRPYGHFLQMLSEVKQKWLQHVSPQYYTVVDCYCELTLEN